MAYQPLQRLPVEGGYVQLAPVPLAFGSFTTQRTGLRGGANAYFEVAGSATVPQLLNVRAVGGGAPATTLRVAIARVQ